MSVCLWKEEIWTQTHKHGEHYAQMKAESRVMHPQSKEYHRVPANYQKPRESHVTESPSQPQKEPNLPTVWSWISSLQNWETIHFCYLGYHFVILCSSKVRQIGRPWKREWLLIMTEQILSVQKWVSSQRSRKDIPRKKGAYENVWKSKKGCASSLLWGDHKLQQWSGENTVICS